MKNKMGSKISIIIPTFNEEKYIGLILNHIRNFFKGPNYEIIVSADGCTDNTPYIINKLSKVDRRIKIVNTRKRLGKGGGLKKGFYTSSGKIIVFADADMSCSASEISKLIELIKNADIVIASRAIKGANVVKRQSFIREHMGKTFNLLVRLILGINLKDTQCGYKVFKRHVLEKLLPNVKSNGWEFDAELLFRATKGNYKIHEVGVKWKNRKESKLSIFPDSLRMLLGLIKIRLSD